MGFGLSEICGQNEIVFLDSSVLQWKPSYNHVDEKFGNPNMIGQLPSYNPYHNEDLWKNLLYMTELRDFMGKNIFITPCMKDEHLYFSAQCESFKLPRRYKAVIQYLCEYASQRAMQPKPEERSFIEKASDHFGWYSQFISPEDYGLIMHALAAGNSGKTGILSDDGGLIDVFNCISREIGNGSSQFGVRNHVRIYKPDRVNFNSVGRFLERGTYTPCSVVQQNYNRKAS